MKKYLEIGVAVVIIVAAIVGAITYFAKAKDVELVEFRLDQKIQDDRFANIQRRIWALNGQYGEGCQRCPPVILKEYQDLLIELDRLKRQRKKEGR